VQDLLSVYGRDHRSDRQSAPQDHHLRALDGILNPTHGRLFLDVTTSSATRRAKAALDPSDDPHMLDRLTVWAHFQFMAAVYRLRRTGRTAESRSPHGADAKRDAWPSVHVARHEDRTGDRRRLAARPRAVCSTSPSTAPNQTLAAAP